jgi:hypothetical protein
VNCAGQIAKRRNHSKTELRAMLAEAMANTARM